METIGVYPAITASIGGKQRRLTLNRQWRRAIENGELERTTPVHYEPGSGLGAMVEAQACPELASLFDEIKGPILKPSLLPEQPAAQNAETKTGRSPDIETANIKTEITTPKAKKTAHRRRGQQVSPDPTPVEQNILSVPSTVLVAERTGLDWAIKPLRDYAVFTGRSRRKEYWSFLLFVMIPLGVFFGIAAAAENQMMAGLIAIVFLAMIIPGLALTVRRLHDRGHSGWLLLFFGLASMIPIVGVMFSLYFWVLLALPGTNGSNPFGPDPKA